MSNIQLEEHNEYLAGLMSAGEYDRAEAQMGAGWINNWKDEYLLSSRDVWYSNPHYQGPEGPHPEFDYREENEEDQESIDLYQADLLAYYEAMTQLEWAEQIIGDTK